MILCRLETHKPNLRRMQLCLDGAPLSMPTFLDRICHVWVLGSHCTVWCLERSSKGTDPNNAKGGVEHLTSLELPAQAHRLRVYEEYLLAFSLIEGSGRKNQSAPTSRLFSCPHTSAVDITHEEVNAGDDPMTLYAMISWITLSASSCVNESLERYISIALGQ